MYYVVQFLTETDKNGVAIVPENWYRPENGETFYPNYKSDARIARAAVVCETPGADWELYDVRILVQASK